MSEKRYIDEGWTDLPLPDADLAWQKMELLLDRDKRRRAIPFWVWGMMVCGFVVSGLWLVVCTNTSPVASTSADNKTIAPTAITKESAQTNIATINNEPTVDANVQKEFTASPTPAQVAPTTQAPSPQTFKPKQASYTTKRSTVRNQKPVHDFGNSTATKAAGSTNPPSSNTSAGAKPSSTASSNPTITIGSSTTTTAKTDIITKLSDTAKAITAPQKEKEKDTRKKENRIVWSAGIGLQQAIAVAGQSSSSYNYNGRSASFTDRIPSAYLRMQKGKWFVQAEAMYAAPQPVRSFYFSQQSRYDAASTSLQTERFAIQKLYYHQLPVSINYHVLPNLSVGVGSSYNILAGAVTEQEVTTKNASTGAESTTARLAPVKGFKDSFLYKTTAGVLLQTDYHLKRFSFGLRYTQNLQPFIRYTLPDGTLMDEKTGVLQAVLRFRLWSSK